MICRQMQHQEGPDRGSEMARGAEGAVVVRLRVLVWLRVLVRVLCCQLPLL